MNADIQVFRPRPSISYGEDEEGFGGASSPSVEPRFPKSLFLVHPLFSVYELNPVAASAQASVPIPDGLDLDAWIVPPPREETIDEGEGRGDAAVKVKKSKKGKGKAIGNGKSKKQKRGDVLEYEPEDDDTSAAQTPIETEEEKAERERVSCHFCRVCQTSEVLIPAAFFAIATVEKTREAGKAAGRSILPHRCATAGYPRSDTGGR